MGIVRFALRFPHTFYVLAALILFLGVAAIRSMPTDIFPEIRIPVVTVIWQYTGLSTPEMEQRVTTYSQYAMSTQRQRHQEYGSADHEWSVGSEGIFPAGRQSRPRHCADRVGDELQSASLMPPGIQPPIIVQFNASSVPVLQISLTSDTPQRAAAL